jgi:hypothetical protein
MPWNPFSRTQKENGTYEGSRVGNLIRRSASIVTGIGPQPVLFDYDMGKFKVDIATKIGKKSFQIIGNNASELKADYDKKLGQVSNSAALSGAKTAKSYIPSVQNPFYYKKAPTNNTKRGAGRRNKRGTRRA